MKHISLAIVFAFFAPLYSETLKVEILNEAKNHYDGGRKLEAEGKTVKANREKSQAEVILKKYIKPKKRFLFPDNCTFKYLHGKLFDIQLNCSEFEGINFSVVKNDPFLEKLEDCKDSCTGEFIFSNFRWGDKCLYMNMDRKICAKKPIYLDLTVKFLNLKQAVSTAVTEE